MTTTGQGPDTPAVSTATASFSGPDLEVTIDGVQHHVPESAATLLDTLRSLGHVAVKDGCSPQGQCGCCTVLVDGQPRVACVTPIRRVNGRHVTTPAGLDDVDTWAEAVCATGASQCGFCTPGIIVRLSGLLAKKPDAGHPEVQRALAAHLCRCTGWNTLLESWDLVVSETPAQITARTSGRDFDSASRRAEIEGRNTQTISSAVAAGSAVFASDTSPEDALVALRRSDGSWAVGESLAEARELAGKIQGRRTTLDPHYPVEIPAGEWAATLQTTWVEPAYLETDASWCAPGGEPSSALANGGAFGGKVDAEIGSVARRLADEHGRTVRVLYSREDSTRFGAKRPPLAGGVNADGTGHIVVARTPGIVEAIANHHPRIQVTEIDVPGPPTSSALRAAGWAEAAALVAAAAGAVGRVTSPEGGWVEVELDEDGTISLTVDAGEPLDEIMLRSYCIGAAHMGLSWVRSEAMAVDDAGEIHDLTVRSFGVLRASDMPAVAVDVVPSDRPAVHVSDAVFAAVASAAWLAAGAPARWPVGGSEVKN